MIAAVVPPVLVAFSRTAPEAVIGVAIAVSVLDSLEASPSGTFGAGVAGMAIVFALAAWSRQPWPWLVAVVVAATMQDLRIVNFDLSDIVIDWVFIGFVFSIGRMVHRRTAQADELNNQLRLAELDREARAREAVTHERARIARELHDIVAHSVSLMVVQAGTARPHANGSTASSRTCWGRSSIRVGKRSSSCAGCCTSFVPRTRPITSPFQTSRGSMTSSKVSDAPGSRSAPASTCRAACPRALRCVGTARCKRG